MGLFKKKQTEPPSADAAAGEPEAAPPAPATDAAVAEAPVNKASLNQAFIMVYRITSTIAAALFIGIFILSVMDILVYMWRELHQQVVKAMDPNLINGKTTDIQALQYIKNNPDEEPYNIFMEQRLVTGIYIVVGASITLLGLQMAIFFGMKLYSIVAKREFNDTLDIPFNYMGLLMLCYVGAVVLSYIYKTEFVKDAQVKMKNVRTQLRGIKNFMYDNMISDSAFLRALQADDFDAIMSSFLKNTTNLATLRKMMFTYNVYSYFSSQIPESDPNYDTLTAMFSTDGMQKQKVDPTLLLHYKRPIYIPNLYPSIRNKISKSMTKVNERAFLRDFGAAMKTLNKKLVRVQNISEGKSSVLWYMLKVLLVTILMTIVIVLMLLFIFLSGVFSKISGFVLGLFGRTS